MSPSDLQVMAKHPQSPLNLRVEGWTCESEVENDKND